MKKILLIAIIAVASSCALPQKLQLGGESGPGNKTVTAKEEPATLVAVDGTQCLVTPARFDRVKTGDRVWCNWMPRGAG